MDIPCDMSKTGYCDVSGVAYPWAAVRRYIYENQGMLRRMYGDQRHYQIVTNEIQDLKEKYDNIYLYEKGRYSSKKRPQFRPRSMGMDGHDAEDLDGDREEEEDTFRVEESAADKYRPTSEATANRNETLSYNQAMPLGESATRSSVKSPVDGETTTEATGGEESTTFEFSATELLTTMTTSSSSESQPNNMRPKEVSIPPTTEATSSSTPQSTSLPPPPPSSTNSLQSPSSSFADPFGSATTQPTSPPLPTSPSPSPSQSPPTTPSTLSSVATEKPVSAIDESVPKKGVNACPVREEVIAPYWANNTRGEILALLNVYPFEQYVHWEKCAYENMQMFCRPGCRCEQQYRLHRLLAFDPKNECRGIFADWFRFPSCCVCICYDLPESNVLHRVNNRRKGRL